MSDSQARVVEGSQVFAVDWVATEVNEREREGNKEDWKEPLGSRARERDQQQHGRWCLRGGQLEDPAVEKRVGGSGQAVFCSE